MAIPETYCKDCPCWSGPTRECRAGPPLAQGSNPQSVSGPIPVWPPASASHWCTFGRVITETGVWPGSSP